MSALLLVYCLSGHICGAGIEVFHAEQELPTYTMTQCEAEVQRYRDKDHDAKCVPRGESIP